MMVAVTDVVALGETTLFVSVVEMHGNERSRVARTHLAIKGICFHVLLLSLALAALIVWYHHLVLYLDIGAFALKPRCHSQSHKRCCMRAVRVCVCVGMPCHRQEDILSS